MPAPGRSRRTRRQPRRRCGSPARRPAPRGCRSPRWPGTSTSALNLRCGLRRASGHRMQQQPGPRRQIPREKAPRLVTAQTVSAPTPAGGCPTGDRGLPKDWAVPHQHQPTAHRAGPPSAEPSRSPASQARRLVQLRRRARRQPLPSAKNPDNARRYKRRCSAFKCLGDRVVVDVAHAVHEEHVGTQFNSGGPGFDTPSSRYRAFRNSASADTSALGAWSIRSTTDVRSGAGTSRRRPRSTYQHKAGAGIGFRRPRPSASVDKPRWGGGQRRTHRGVRRTHRRLAARRRHWSWAGRSSAAGR